MVQPAVQPAMLVLAVLLFLASPNLLYRLGLAYSASGGSTLAKIHPAFYWTCLVLAVFALRRARQNPAHHATMHAAWLMAGVTLAALAITIATTRESGGGELSALVVTWLLPALVLMVLSFANPSSLRAMASLLAWLFLVNSTIATLESRTGLRLLPFVAGDAVLDFDRRPTALLGHPLTNATLTGGWLLLGAMRLFRDGLRPAPVAIAAWHALALLSFGGRVALVAMLGALALFIVLHTMTQLARGGGGRELLRAFAMAAITAILVLPAVWFGMADLIIARFADGRGSDETRLAALQILFALEPEQWLSGAPVSLRETLQMRFGTPYGIELSWVALVVTFGLPVAAGLLTASLVMFTAASAGRGAQAAMLCLYFLATTFGSLSIGSKSLLLSQFLVLLFCSPTKTKATSSNTSSPSPHLLLSQRRKYLFDT